MSQQPRSRSIDPPAAADATPASAALPAPSNAPTIFLLILVIGMMGFIAWWAFLSEGARAKANAILPAPSVPQKHPPRLDATPASTKPMVAPVPAASSAAPDNSAQNEAAPVISEVPAPATKRQGQKPVSRAAESDD